MLSITAVFSLAVLATVIAGQNVDQPKAGTVRCNYTAMETCDLTCEHGMSTDINGCRQCKCQTEICQVRGSVNICLNIALLIIELT